MTAKKRKKIENILWIFRAPEPFLRVDLFLSEWFVGFSLSFFACSLFLVSLSIFIDRKKKKGENIHWLFKALEPSFSELRFVLMGLIGFL